VNAGKVIEIVALQRSPEWYAARTGRLTGSRAAEMLATTKSGESAARLNYRLQLVVERLTGIAQEDTFVNREMQRGIDLEPAARGAYEAAAGVLVRESGFLAHTELLTGASLDGDVGNFQGIVEIKCPKSTTHVKYLKATVLPPEYEPQVKHNLWISGATWCDFVSFDDRLPQHLRLFRVRVFARDLNLAAYEMAALKFISEVQADVDSLQPVGEGAAS
jgi:putative phage-type endonuclease